MKNLVLFIIVFSAIYWFSALVKPFTADEYYSWAYAEKMSFAQILSLTDSGIGHPPLYHLLIKTTQIIPQFSPRLINYFASLFFIFFLFRLPTSIKPTLIVYLGFIFSASVLNIFLLSRMWGLVLLFSSISILYTENYINSKKKRHLIIALITICFGFVTDYSFVLLVPYFILSYFFKKENYRKIVTTLLLFLIFCFLLIYILKLLFENLSFIDIGYEITNNFFEVLFSNIVTIINFGYYEFYFIPILVFAIIAYREVNRKHSSSKTYNQFKKLLILSITYTIFLITYIFIKKDILETRFSAILAFSFILILMWYFFIKHKVYLKSTNWRYVFSIIFGLLIVFIVAPIFWTKLTEVRYFMIFFPLFFLLIVNNFQQPALKMFSIILLFSGILFILSNRVDTLYPAENSKTSKVTIFNEPGSFATSYIKQGKPKNLYILEQSFFTLSCRVCQMGESEPDYKSIRDFDVIHRNDFDMENKIPANISKISETASFNAIDNFLNVYLTPINKFYYIKTSYSLNVQ